ncbi:MAG: hypothetical protein CL489_08545 [Acidobacteria bacterium]|nr:hypothetical protein [Acidobacteriota bacterium]|tara:strand:- start:43672 stop:43905 length:234 start_codon:yes stop_codon:yes gene_type:complete
MNKQILNYIICVIIWFAFGLVVSLSIAQNWDIVYTNEIKTIERAENACKKHESVPYTYDWKGNVKCENGISFNVQDW